ncbi:MAG TPA: hypothetical protein VEI54_07630 [Candidatus Limnocylindrales bacterium]|nr:hypothetical protein [Candidatus Limnocylindrales bacterium]
MHRAKTALRFVVIFVVAFLFFDVTTIVDRRDYRKAVFNYTRNPTAENEALVRSERQKNEWVKALDAAAGAAIVTAAAFGVLALYRSFRKPNQS